MDEQIIAQGNNVLQHYEQNQKFKRFPNEKYIHDFDFTLQKYFMYRLSGLDFNYHTSNYYPQKTVPFKPFNKDMKQICINQLTLGHVHQGYYLPLKIIREPIIMASIAFMAKDINGDIIKVAMYNYQSVYNVKSFEEGMVVFASNKWVIVIDPFYKLYKDNFDGLRSDDPKDILLFDNEEAMKEFIKINQPISIKEMNEKANQYIQNKQYDDAIEYYKRALKKDLNNPILNSYLAERYLRIEYFSQAKIYADIALKQDPNNPQILFQKCKTLIGLKEYTEAYRLATCDQLKNGQKLQPIKLELEEKIRNTQGIYKLHEMLQKEKTDYYLNYGDYVNEKVALSHDNGKGVKVIALKHIAKGELISATKALMAIPSTLEQHLSSHEQLRLKLAKKIKKSPLDFPAFFELCDGFNKDKDHNTRRASINTSYDKINSVIKHNSFFLQRPILELTVRTLGLWIFPSFFNHACLANALYFDIGDFLFVTANIDILPQQEITINYRPFTVPYHKRQKELLHLWNIECNCELCVYEDKQLKNCPEKMQLYSYMSLFNGKECPSSINLEEIDKFLDDNKKLFSCYEMGLAYYNYGMSLIKKDGPLGVNILQKGLRYAVNRNPVLERYILYEIAKHYYTTGQNELYDSIKTQIKQNMMVYISKEDKFNEEIILQAMNKKE